MKKKKGRRLVQSLFPARAAIRKVREDVQSDCLFRLPTVAQVVEVVKHIFASACTGGKEV